MLAALLLLLAPAAGAPLQDAGLSAAQRESMRAEAQQAWREANQQQKAGNWEQALEPCERMLELELALLGERHDDVAGSRHMLASSLWHLGEYEAARDQLEIVEQLTVGNTDLPWDVYGLADLDLLETASDAERERLYASELLQPRIRRLYDAQRHDEAAPLVAEQLAAREAVFGTEHRFVAKGCSDLGLLEGRLLEFRASEELQLRGLAIRERTLGDEHPLYAESLNNVATLWTFLGRHVEAVPLLERSTEMVAAARGEFHANHLIGLDNLHRSYQAVQRFEDAERVARRMLEVALELHGSGHANYAGAQNALAADLVQQGLYGEAEALLLEAIESLRSLQPSPARVLAGALTNLAVVHGDRGRPHLAEPLFREALELVSGSRAGQSADQIVLLGNLARHSMQLGDTARAIELTSEAVGIAERLFGVSSHAYASLQNNLAVQLSAAGRWEEAATHVRRARAVFEAPGLETSPQFALTLGNQAALELRAGDLDAAQAAGERALAIVRAAPGGAHPRYASIYVLLSEVHRTRGELEQAREFLAEALERTQSAVGGEHPDLGPLLCNLSELEHLAGRHEPAAALHRRALKVFRANLEWVANVQSERQQLSLLAVTRNVLDSYVSLAPLAGIPADEVYAEVLAWKGSIFARQRRMHLESRHPQLADEFRALQELTDRFAAAALSEPPESNLAAWREAREALRGEREARERALAERTGHVRGVATQTSVRPEELRAALPEGTVLVDFLVHEHLLLDPGAKGVSAGPRARSPWVTAFVTRAGAPVARVDLGSYSDLEAQVSLWRTQLATEADGEPASARTVRRRIWAPLEEALGEARTVLISPDAGLARLPFAALPGIGADTYLIEELRLAIVPAPQRLPELLGRDRGHGLSEPSLLALGGVDFERVADDDEAPEVMPAYELAVLGRGVPAGSASIPFPFTRLPASALEVDAIARLFEQSHPDADVTRLLAGRADERRFRELVPRHRFVHLATHGFFAGPLAPASLGARPTGSLGMSDPEPWKELVGPHPGLLSGIVLAGANARAGELGPDGILSALEMATLDLAGVELMTLSACETGLGASAGGEGLLGLLRAAQVAGTRSVVASLWRVDDTQTRRLMTRMYVALWREGSSRAEALQRAQLAAIEEGLAPRHWAAWLVSGDWR